MTRRMEIARAGALIGYIATQELSISGSELGRRFKIDRSAANRAVRQVARDPHLIEAASTVRSLLKPTASQQ